MIGGHGPIKHLQDLNWGTFDHASHAPQLRSYNYNAPIKVMPHLPPSGHRWAHGWGFDHLVVYDPACGAKSAIKCPQIPLSRGQWLDIHNTGKQRTVIRTQLIKF